MIRGGVSAQSLRAVTKDLGLVVHEVQGALTRATLRAGMLVHGEAIASIQAHRSKGRSYVVPRSSASGSGRRRGADVTRHTASLPGFPPNTNRGGLVRGIILGTQTSGMRRSSITVRSTAQYSAALEFGSVNAAARPFLWPAIRDNRDKIRGIYRQEIQRAIKGIS